MIGLARVNRFYGMRRGSRGIRFQLPRMTSSLRDEALKSDVKIEPPRMLRLGLVMNTGFPSLLRTGDRNGTIRRNAACRLQWKYLVEIRLHAPDLNYRRMSPEHRPAALAKIL